MSADQQTSVALPVATAARSWRELRWRCRAQRLLLAGLVAILLVATLAGIAVALLIGVLVDDLIEGTTIGRVDAIAIAVLVCAVLSSLLHGAGLALTGVISERLLARLREDVVDVAMRLPVVIVERAGSGDLVSRVSGDIEVIAKAAHGTLPTLGRAGFTVALTGAGLMFVHPLLALAALVAVPLQVRGLRRFLFTSADVFAREREAVGRRTQAILDAVIGAATIRAYRTSARHRHDVETSSAVAIALGVRAARIRSGLTLHLNVAELAGLTSLLVVGFLLVEAGNATVGDVTATALLWLRLFDPISELLELVNEVQSAGAALARLVGVTDAADDAPEPRTARRSSGGDAAVELRGVGHAYVDGHPVLTDVTFTVPSGRTVAIVGASGAGKTTIARIIAGTLTPTSGQVLVPSDARVALLTQDVHVFRGSLAADLRLAAQDASDGELRSALDAVAARWVSTLPDGLATIVGEGAHRLDPAQAGQLALARVLLTDPAVAVLDEATAEAGSSGARQLEQAAAAVLDGRTAIVIAHRLSQARLAHEIIVVDAGHVVERGPHDALICADGMYARLWDAWDSRR